MYRMMGEFLVQTDGKFEHQGSAWNFKATGMKIFKVFKKHHMFYVFHTRNDASTRKTWTWKYWTNNLQKVTDWYNNKS